MASTVFTGTATDHKDLLTKVKGHLSSGTLGSQAWTILESTSAAEDCVYMKGPGLSGTDEIYVNFRTVTDVGQDMYNWEIQGAVAYDSQNSYDFQPGQSPLGHCLFWDSTIPYWLIVNGRRFILIAKVSTTYQTCYCGLFLPYATSSEMPYPMCIMTSSGGNVAKIRWSAGTYQVGGFWDPIDGSSYVRHWNGTWVPMANLQYRTDTTLARYSVSCVWPWEQDYGFGENIDGKYGLLPSVMHSSYGDGNVLGELEGVYFITGFSEGAEDTITIGGDQYLVVQAAYRTGRNDYAAIKLG